MQSPTPPRFVQRTLPLGTRIDTDDTAEVLSLLDELDAEQP